MKCLIATIVVFIAAVCATDAFSVKSASSRAAATELRMTVLTYGNNKKDFRPGSPLKSACAALGVKPRYSCKNGECNSCVLTVGGIRMKPCVDKVPPEPRLKSLQEKGLAIK